MAKPDILERHIVAKGNYPMVARGLNLFNKPIGKVGEKLHYNVSPGQLVAFTVVNGAIPTTVDETDIATISGDLYLGVGWDSNGDGTSDDVRLIAGDYLQKCQVDQVDIGKPECGTPAIKGSTIDCVNCETTYTAKVTIDDNRSRSWGPFNKSGIEFLATYKPTCATCEDCSVEANCKEIICGLVDSLNGELNLTIGDTSYPDWKGHGMPRPYRAVVVHPNWFTYCFQPDAATCDCDTCTKIDSIGSFEPTGVNAIPLVGNLDPSDQAKTMIAQLKNIAFQIEAGMEAAFGRNSAFAFVSQGVTSCCPIQLHVVTCDATFQLFDIDDELVPACPDVIDPAEFLSFPGVKECANCTGAVPAPYVAPCALAVLVDPAKPDCKDCYLDRPWTWYGVKLDVEIMKDANSYAPITKNFTIMEATSPKNFGSQIQWLEYKFGFGPAGRGRRHRASNYRTPGFLNKFDDTSRIKNAVTAKCDALYCSYLLEHVRTLRSSAGNVNALYDFRSGIHIRTEDTTTITDFETFFTALVTADNSNCKVLAGVTCLGE